MLILINTNILKMALHLIQKETFSCPTGGFDKNVIIFGADVSSSVHVDNKKKDILILGEGPTQELDDTALTAFLIETNYCKKPEINMIIVMVKSCRII